MRTIYHGGVVYTGEMPLQEAFAVEGDEFCFVGTDAEARALARDGDELVDLKGRFVCAGFNDSHMHLLNYGALLARPRLDEHTSSLADVQQCLRDYMKGRDYGGGEWLVGRGWNQDLFTDVHRMPDRHDLDEVSRDVPIIITRVCGHCVVANSRAIELMGVTASTPQPEGGRIGITDGELDGRFYENAMDIPYLASPPPSRAELKEMIRRSCEALNAYGVTSAQTDDYSSFQNVPWREVDAAYRELEEAGELSVRVYEQANFTTIDALADFISSGHVTGAGSEMLKTGPLKMLGDGALGSRTAFLSRPYADDPNTKGISIFTQEQFDEMIEYANDRDMQVAVHTIGDACLDRVLAAIERALAKHPRADHRHGVVHVQITRPDQLRKICEMGLHVYAQSIFLDYDTKIVHRLVGDELASTSYSWKTLMNGGASVSNGSDGPVELPNVMASIQCGVTRASLAPGSEPYLPEQAFTVQEALDSYTIKGAEASFEERRKGRIAPGMLADFVVLGADPFKVPPRSLKDVPILCTYLGGREVFRAG